MLLYRIWLVVNGALSPSVLILDVFVGEILNFLDIIRVCYSHLFSLSIYRETEKDQSEFKEQVCEEE